MRGGLIGVAGCAGAGKSSVAAELLALGYESVDLSDPLKRLIRDLYGASVSQLWGPSRERATLLPRGPRVSVRAALQQLGDALRASDPDYLVTPALHAAWSLTGDTGGTCVRYEPERGLVVCAPRPAPLGIVIGGVRYPSEVDAIRRAGGIVVRVERDGAGLGWCAEACHDSELPLSDVDFVIRNDGPLSEAAEELRSLVMELAA